MFCINILSNRRVSRKSNLIKKFKLKVLLLFKENLYTSKCEIRMTVTYNYLLTTQTLKINVEFLICWSYHII